MSITLTLDKTKFEATMARLLDGVKDFRDVSPTIATLLENSVRLNFREGGRPIKWPRSKRADRDAGYGKESGKTLIDNGILESSFTSVGDKLSVTVGTNVDYAGAHHYGVDEIITQQVKEHVRRVTQAFGRKFGSHGIGTAATITKHSRKVHMKIPARPFMLIQEEDWEDVHDIITAKLQTLFGRA